MINSIFYKSLSALYNLNLNKNGETKSIIVDSIYKGLLIGKEGLDQAKLEMALKSATGQWLDYWGNFYGVFRINKELDDPYRERIIEEVIAPKSTIPALKRATSRYLRTYQGQSLDSTSVKAFEPWTHLLKFDERGTLDGAGRLISYDYWNYAIVDISLPETSLITPELIKYLNKIKAGGVKLVFSLTPNWGIVKDPLWEEKRYNVWERIYKHTIVAPKRRNGAFKLLMQGWNPKIVDTSAGGRLDDYLVLEGSQKIFWVGIQFNREYYATGVLREFRNSSVLSLHDYEKIVEPNLTLEQAFNLEEEALTGTREVEGRLTHKQAYINVKTEFDSIYTMDYIPYTKANSNLKSYRFPYSDVLDHVSYEEISNRVDISNMSIEDFYSHFELPKLLEDSPLSNLIRELRLKLMKEAIRKESLQYPMKVTTTPI